MTVLFDVAAGSLVEIGRPNSGATCVHHSPDDTGPTL
jgi:hypothetical protein